MFAYIDPGAGSVIATFLVGGVAAVGTALRATGSKFTGIFSRNKKDAEPATEAEG